MALINHNISTPNDGLGDELRTAFGNQNEMNTELYADKVDKVTGKGLSANDYTNTEKTKLAAIEAGAEVNVQSDWNQTDDTQDDYIKNKPLNNAGYYNYLNGLTAQTVVSATELKLLNNGISTSENVPYGVTKLWNNITNSFYFDELIAGDMVMITCDVTSDVDYKLRLKLGDGQIIESISTFYISANDDIIAGTNEIYLISPNSGTASMENLYVSVLRKGLNIVSFSGIQDITAGTNVTIDKTDPLNPVISASGGGVPNFDDVTTEGNTTPNGINVGASEIKGIGTTNATKALIIRNSNNTERAYIDDAGNMKIYGALYTGGAGNNGQLYANFLQVLINGGLTDGGGTTKFTMRYVSPTNFGWDSKGIIKYTTDYSPYYDARSLVDKAYVDSVAGGGGGSTDLSYTASQTDGTVISSTGTDATIPLVDGTNAGLISPTQLSSKQDVLTASNTHTFVDSLTAMTTPVDADKMVIVDNSVSLSKKITWGNIKATLKTYFDSFYTVKNTAITGATKTKITYDANGLVTSGADATTADIAEDGNLYFTNNRAIASTLANFVAGTGAISSSDTILTAIQKLAGNSGLSKIINDTTASSSNTGVTTEVVMKTYEITGGTFVSGSKPNITIGSTKSSGSNAIYTMRLYAGSSNTFASATVIGTFATSSAFIRGFNFERRGFYFDGTTLKGYLPTTSARTDITELSTTQWSGMTLNPANSIFIFVTLQNGSALDTTRIDYVNITE